MLHVLTHSFPTRRSSDLLPLTGLILLFKPFLPMFRAEQVAVTIAPLLPLGVIVASLAFISRRLIAPNAWAIAPALLMRSEEHTSELQSLMRISYAVFCLKKKNTNTSIKHSYYTYL